MPTTVPPGSQTWLENPLFIVVFLILRPLSIGVFTHVNPMEIPLRLQQQQPRFHRFLHHLFHGHVFDGDLRDFRDVLLAEPLKGKDRSNKW
jgi:hypothetical protein